MRGIPTKGLSIKNLSLGLKIASGFALLIIMAMALGGMALWNMNNVETQSTMLANEYVPEVGVAMDARAGAYKAQALRSPETMQQAITVFVKIDEAALRPAPRKSGKMVAQSSNEIKPNEVIPFDDDPDFADF